MFFLGVGEGGVWVLEDAKCLYAREVHCILYVTVKELGRGGDTTEIQMPEA